MASTYNAGVVTAYGAAKQAGYTGTYAEFQTLMASYATVAETTRGYKEDAEAAANYLRNMTATATGLAEGSAPTANYDTNTGVLSLGIPKGDTGATGATGATGNGIASIAKTSTVGLVDTYTITYTNGNTSTFEVTNGQTPTVDSAMSSSSENPVQNKVIYNEITPLKSAIPNKAPVITETATGSIASFADGADGMPMKSVVCEINPVQSGSGDPSPTNVRPISGFTGLTVTRTGKNLFGGTQLRDVIISKVSGSSATDTTVSYSSNAIRDINIFDKFKENTQYTFIFSGTGSTQANATNLKVEYTDGTYVYVVNFTDGLSVTVSATNKSIKCISGEWITGTTTLNFNECGIFEGVLTADDFEAYNGTTVNVDWTDSAGTVYGGSLDVTTGVLTVDRAMLTLNTADMDNHELYPGWNDSGVKALVGGGLDTRYINSILNVGNIVRVNTIGSYNDIVYFNATDYNLTQPQWIALAIDVQIVFLLATQRTYQLTAHEVASLLGANNLWHDANGDTTAEYCADTKLYINSFTEPDDDMVADANITSGSYFIVNNTLYLATAAIAQGAAIVEGTNCTKTDIASALNALNA